MMRSIGFSAIILIIVVFLVIFAVVVVARKVVQNKKDSSLVNPNERQATMLNASKSDIDKEIANLLKANNGKISSVDLTSKTGIPLDKAKEKLDSLAKKNVLGIDSDDNGMIFYTSN